jgi:hypothetical protein
MTQASPLTMDRDSRSVFSHSDDTGSRWIAIYFYLAPFFWLLGLQAVASLVLLLMLVTFRWPSDGRANLVFAFWLLASIAQAAAVFYNWSILSEPLMFLFRQLASFNVIGWLVLGVVLASGCAWQAASKKIVRAIMIYGLYVIILTVIALGIAYASSAKEYTLTTPMQLLLGADSERYTTAGLFTREDTFGQALPRLVLFFPYPTALGLAGLAIFMISFCEKHRWWRIVGFTAGLCAVVFSFSRAAIVILPVTIAVFYIAQGRGTIWALSFTTAGALLALMGILIDPEIFQSIFGLSESFSQARSGSSLARSLLNEVNWQGFLDSPVFGQGWCCTVSVHPKEYLPIGTHSAFYGTLYTGGVAAFGSLILAVAGTAFVLLTEALKGRVEAAASLAIMVAVFLYGYGESLFDLVLPCMFIFLFIGSSLGSPKQP